MDWHSFMTMVYLGCVYLAWVLLPLIPAVITFLLFPSTAVGVSGPLSYLKLNASGAFAAYLVIFVATTPLINSIKDTIGGFSRQFWTLKAEVRLLNSEGKEIRADNLLSKIRVQPSSFVVERYEVKIKLPEEDGQPPAKLYIEIPEFGEGEPLNIRSLVDARTTNKFLKTIELEEPIRIHQLPPTNPNRVGTQSRTEHASTDSSDFGPSSEIAPQSRELSRPSSQ